MIPFYTNLSSVAMPMCYASRVSLCVLKIKKHLEICLIKRGGKLCFHAYSQTGYSNNENNLRIVSRTPSNNNCGTFYKMWYRTNHRALPMLEITF